jgi:ribosomal protein S18 acetylase RimI-like enzyme
MTIHVRAATPQDIDIIVRLIQELVATGGEVSPISATYVEKYLASPQSKVLLAEVNEQIAGLISYSIRPDLYHAGDCCLVEELMVQEGARGRGIGSALLTELFSRLKDCVEVGLGVMPDNTRAIAFYRKHGLVEEALLLERHLR